MIRTAGPVEIVSTPAEAMAGVSRISGCMTSEYDMNDEDDFSSENGVVGNTLTKQTDEMPMYRYYYVGSCVAIHEYTSKGFGHFLYRYHAELI